MLKNFLLNNTIIPKIAKGLDVYSLRQKIIADNIANVQTPGYRRKEVDFEEYLQNAVSGQITGMRTNANHLPVGGSRMTEVEPRIQVDTSPELKSGVNNVDIEREMVDQVKNEIRFLYSSQLARRNFAKLRASIKGRFDI